MGVEQNKINDYLDKVCSFIKNRDVHDDIKLELKDHIEAIKEEGLASGLSEEDALDKALEHMGDAALVGRQLNKSHRSRLDLFIFIPILFLCFFGAMSMYFIQKTGVSEAGLNEIFQKSLTFYAIGIVLIVGLFLFDYRKLLNFSRYIYIGSVLILAFTILFGDYVNGVQYLSLGAYNINFAQISPFFLIIALAGIFHNWNFADLKKYVPGLTLMALPALLILIHKGSFPTLIVYSVACLVLLIASKVKLYQAAIPVAGSIFIGFMFILTEPFRIRSLVTFLDPYKDATGRGWVYVQLKNALNSAGFLGRGIGSTPKNVPNLHEDYVFTYFIHTFGWFAAVVLLLLISLFVIRMIKVSNFTKGSYGKLLVKGITAILCTQFILSITTSLGISPFFGVSMPFMSFGGSQILSDMMAAGLILSVYRRKGLTPAVNAI